MAKLTTKRKKIFSATPYFEESFDIDAAGKVLGRLATEVAKILIGKDRSDFKPNVVRKVRVRVYNTDNVKFTGKKTEQKIYLSYSGYPGGLKEKNLGKLMKDDSRKVIWQAVWGMLPKNKLRKERIKNLELYKAGLPLDKEK
jgi:large subunit ribosomal protein L13